MATAARNGDDMLEKLFGPSRETVWRQLAEELGAQYVDGGMWRGDKVEGRAGSWTVTLDTYAVSTGKTVVVFTRLRAPFVNRNGFRFSVRRQGLFSEIAIKLGGQDVEIGWPEFDDAFVLKGTDEDKVRELFARPRLRELLADQPDVHLEVCDDEGWLGPDFPEGVDELRFHTVGIIRDVERLKGLYQVFAETLEQLCEIGCATPADPGVKVR
jgi:hypothetical protein